MHFQIMALTPPGLIDSPIAIAASRAGGIGVLDLEYARNVESALSEMDKLCRFTDKPCGIKLDGRNEEFLKKITTRLPGNLEFVVVANADPAGLRQWVKTLHDNEKTVLLEAVSTDHALLGVEAGVDGIIARGNESGGRIGEETTFDLLQRILSAVSIPVWAHGGIGLHSAAACYAAGAAGVVLDSQLLLTRESQLSEEVKAILSGMDGSESSCLGEELGLPFRACMKADLPVVDTLKQLESRLAADSLSRPDLEEKWHREIKGHVGWGSSGKNLWLIGQDVALASPLADRYMTVGGILEALRQAVDDQIEVMTASQPLQENSSLANAHGMRFPIIQETVTEAADGGALAVKIAEAGALPMLNLGTMRGPEVKALLDATCPAIGEQPWGIGVTISDQKELRQEQLDAAATFQPPLALIPGEGLDQARSIEKEGTSAYLRLSSTELLESLLNDGARRFVFEGREGGRDAGARSSFLLWNAVVDIILDTLPAADLSDCHLLFAGGIRDALSSSMVAALAAPLLRRGVRIGVVVHASPSTEETAAAGAMEELYQDISVEGSGRLSSLARSKKSRLGLQIGRKDSPSDIAIIGMACMLPKAPGLQTYWKNILNKKNAITEVPKDHWDWRLYYDPDPKARDKIYSKWGGFLEPVPFDPMAYGIPPNVLQSIEPLHLLTLESVKSALRDAGYSERPYSKERTSVILGVISAMPDLGQHFVFRSKIPLYFKEISPSLMDQLPEWTEDSFPGMITNVTAGRVANRFDLGGVNYTVDAACAASMAAVHLGVQELENGTSDMVIVGGGDTVQNPWIYLCYSKTQTLSPTGQIRAFDQSADGLVIGEGIATLILKRRADAERDGDRIYALIRGVAGSSDGRSKDLTAPSPEGYKLAVERAYARAGIEPSTVDLIEAHGTGTVVGNQVEVEALKKVFEASGSEPSRCALGSVKSMIGHTKATGGLAGMIKTVLALHHKVLPPTLGVTKPDTALSGSPFYLHTEPHPWVGDVDGQPRRAGVSSFGFGGTNFHTVLEEYRGDIAVENREAVLPDWPVELFVWRGQSREEVIAQVDRITTALEQGAEPSLRNLAFSLWMEAKESSGLTLSVVASSLDDLQKKLTAARKRLAVPAGSDPVRIDDPRGIFYSEEPLARGGKVAFLFPGQGSQYPSMLKDVAIHFEEMREQIELAGSILKDHYPQPLSSYIYPQPFLSEDEMRQFQRTLDQTNVTHPAIGAGSAGFLQLMKKFGISAEMVTGHSYGEWIALYAAGAYGEDFFYRLSESPGRFVMDASKEKDLGHMAAVAVSPEVVEEYLKSIDGVWAANMNSPELTIISGDRSGVEKVVKHFSEQDYWTTPLEVRCAFHSPLVGDVQDRLTAEFFSTIEYAEPQMDVYSNTYAAPYPKDSKSIGGILSEHFLRPVKFAEAIEAMYEAGARVFIEVGPRHVLANLTLQILGDRPHLSVPLDKPDRSGLVQIHHALGQVAAQGVPVQLDRLYQARGVRQYDLDSLVEETKEPALSPMTWMVNGKEAWPLNKGAPETGLAVSAPGLSMGEPGDMEQIAEAAAPAPAAVEKPDQAMPAPAPASPGPRSEDGEVMLRYQQLMNRFLDMQQQVMLAHLGGEGADGGALTAHVTDLERTTSEVLAGMPAAPPATAPTAAEPAEAAAAVEPPPVEEPPATGKLEEVTAHILEVVSERTGYPPDMLDLDLDVEADLGIDSIKRVEILGTIMEAHFADQEMDQETMEELNTRKTLRSIIDWIAEALGDEGQGAAAGDAPSQPAGEPAAASKLETVTAHILEVVSERTGYPPDMLDLDLDVEADLGIDSIKRVEILGTIMEAHFADQEMDQETMEELNTRKTLRSIIDWIAEALGDEMKDAAGEGDSSGVKGPAGAADQESPAAERDDEEFPRFLLAAVDSSLSDEGSLEVPTDSVVVITDEGCGIARKIADELQGIGGRVALVQHQDELDEKEEGLYTANLTSPDGAAELVELVQQRQGPICGVVHLLPLSRGASLEDMSLDDWQARLRLEAKSLFYLARAAGSDLKKAGETGTGWLIGATAMGGVFAADNESKPFFPGSGAVVGLVKSVAAEWPSVRCKAVDLDREAPAEELAGHLLYEMACADGEVEVGYRNSRRKTLRLVEEPLDESQEAGLSPDSNWVVVITGGARGITAEIAAELAERYKPTLYLAGRSPLPEGEEGSETTGITSPKELKAVLIEQLRRTNGKVTPALVEAAYTQLCREREMRDNLAAMERTGSRVHYVQVDVRDEEALGRFIDQVYKEHDRLDLFIHGAGVISDSLIETKAPDSFDKVFDTKADSVFTLSRKLRGDSLQGLVLFSSVAGRIGNFGQTDYAAANEVLNKVAAYLDRQWPGRVVSFNWGPWSDVGMVSPEVQKQCIELGMKLIPPIKGRQLVDRELCCGGKGRVEIVFARGPWEDESVVDLLPSGRIFPLLAHAFPREGADGTVEFRCTVDAADGRYLQDHRLDGTPVVPLAMAMQLMAEAAQRGWPELEFMSIGDLNVLKGIVVDKEQKVLRVAARPVADSPVKDSIVEVDVEISDLSSPPKLHYRATAVLGKQLPTPEPFDVKEFTELPPYAGSVSEAYDRWLFQGPSMQGITEVKGYSEGRIWGILQPSSPAVCFKRKAIGDWLIDPVLVDSAFQLALLWVRSTFDALALPARLGRYQRFADCTGAPVRCFVDGREGAGGNLIYIDVHILDDSDRVIATLKDVEATYSKALDRMLGTGGGGAKS